MQRADFVELFEIMKGLPVTIRLLDPPLHEFLPHTQAEIEEVARAMNTDPRKLADRARDLAEFNPMLGFRGCRLAIAIRKSPRCRRAIFEAAVEAEKRTGKAVGLEVMVPLIATKAEFDLVKARIDATAQSVMKETGKKLAYQVGTMIELPRACLMAGDIAQTAEFFSFGTNDLTQTTYGISRDDAASFLGTYVSKGILEIDPFISVDRDGVGELVKIGVAAAARPGPVSRSAFAASMAAIRIGGVLPRDRARPRLVLALPRADRPPCCSPGRARQDGCEPGVARALTINGYDVMPGWSGIFVLRTWKIRHCEPSSAIRDRWLAIGTRDWRIYVACSRTQCA